MYRHRAEETKKTTIAMADCSDGAHRTLPQEVAELERGLSTMT
jgi:hypothetical protein